MSKIDVNKVKSTFNNTYQYLGRNTSIKVRRNIIKKFLSNVKFQNYTEIGCGDASIALSLMDETKILKLIDVSDHMIDAAKANTPDRLKPFVSYSCENVLNSVPNQKFDLVLCIGLLAHIPSEIELLEYIGKITHNNSIVVLQWTEKNSLQGALLFVFFAKSFGSYTVNKSSGKVINAEMKKIGFRKIKRKNYTQSTFGINKISHNLAYRFKLLTSRISPLGLIFSERIVMYEKSKN